MQRRWRQRRGIAVVLCYHRVVSLPRDPQLLAVSPSNFAQQLDVLAKVAAPMTLPEALTRGRASTRTPVVVTFDDGYFDNLANAKPVLEQHGWPATIFVCTGNVDTRREFWWDDLERTLLGERELPSTFEFEVSGEFVRRDLSNVRLNSDDWDVLAENTPSPRHELYRDLAALLRPLPPDERDASVATLRTWAGVDGVGRKSHRSLTEDEVRRLASDGLVEIGAHTVRHPVLARLSPAQQRQELRRSREHLRELTGASVDSFAYPFGGTQDFSRATVELLKEEGFARACTTLPTHVPAQSDPYRIPRFLVRDWDGDEFARQLATWLP